MYESFFGFAERPFDVVPRTDRYYPSESIEAARQTLIRCIDRTEGCGLVMGRTGVGKTLLLQVLSERFQDQLTPVLLSNSRLSSRKDLLQAILFELGLPYRSMQEGELRLLLIDQLSPGKGQRDGMLLLVDEADYLSPKLFEELRMLTNLVRGGIPRVRLVLAGGPVLEERFATPKLAALNQRVAARCYLDTFTSAETHDFVRALTTATGGDADRIWSSEALRAVFHATDGCPRLINQVCDHALVLAATAKIEHLDQRLVEEAWADLQQLPSSGDYAPSSVAASESAEDDSSNVIEFGSLDDSGDNAELFDGNAEPFDGNDAVQVEPEQTETLVATSLHEPTRECELSADSQLDQIEDHLTDVELALDANMPAEPQIELRFDATLDDDALNDSPELDEEPTADAVGQHDEREVGDEIVIDQFTGLKAETVVPLSPSSQPLSACAGDESVPDGSADAGERSVRSWRQMLDRVTHTDHAETEYAETDHAETDHIETDHIETEHAEAEHAAGLLPLELTARCVDDAQGDKPDIETRTIIVDSHHATIPDAVGTAPPTEEPEPAVQRAAADAVAMQDDDEVAFAEPTSSVPENPMIPVRQRDYRQLFAKLRQRDLV